MRPTHIDAARIARWLACGAWTGETLTARAATIAASEREAIVVVDRSTRLSAARIHELAGRLATAMAERGVAAGDVVAFQLPTWWETLVICQAAWMTGAVVNPIGPNLRARDLEQIFAQARPRLFFAPAEHRQRTIESLVDGLDWVPELVVPMRGDGSVWNALIARPPLAEMAPTEPTSPAMLLFTSGSTGRPKGVIHGHGDLLAEVDGLMRAHQLGTDDKLLVALPVTHIGGVVYAVLAPLLAGVPAVLLEAWDAGLALDLIEFEAVTFMSGVPTYVETMIDHPAFAPERVRSLRLFALGGTRVTPDDVERAAESFGCMSKRSFGMTEVPTLTTGAATDPRRVLAAADGRPIGASQVRIVDPVGVDLPAGERGEIWCEAPEMFLGYLDASLNDAAFSPDGWFRTGDLGMMDDSGSLTLLGRLKDLIIRGGENIAPAEIEQLILELAGVTEVAVVAMPDRVLGERACAFVVTDDPGVDLETVVAHLRARQVASFKLPERVEHRRQLPTTSTGKVRKDLLRREIAEMLQHEAAGSSGST